MASMAFIVKGKREKCYILSDVSGNADYIYAKLLITVTTELNSEQKLRNRSQSKSINIEIEQIFLPAFNFCLIGLQSKN